MFPMKPHYFEQDNSDVDDFMLFMAKGQGYVPPTCLLGGQVVMGLINKGDDPCKGCGCSREKCKGRKK